MTPHHGELVRLASQTRHVLIDFDGPVCSVFAGTSAVKVAEFLRGSLQAVGIPLPTEAATADDPLDLFRIVVTARSCSAS